MRQATLRSREHSGQEEAPERIGCLVERATRRDASAFADLYRLYAPQILQYVSRRVPEPQEAEDVRNIIFEKAFAAIGRYEPSPALFTNWLYTIARNVLIDHYRRRRLPVHNDGADELLRRFNPEDDPEALVLADERRRLLWEELLNLTEDQRQVLGCRFFFNLSIHEVAEMVGKTEAAVKALQFRALERLRRRLAPDWSRI